MDADIPQCPRCKDGGAVALVSKAEDQAVFSPTPSRKRGAELFQCTCGWTMLRTKPKPPKEK
jgi:hypothetical protein